MSDYDKYRNEDQPGPWMQVLEIIVYIVFGVFILFIMVIGKLISGSNKN